MRPLETRRLRLRSVHHGDEDAVHALLSDERVIRYMLFPVFTPERAGTFVARFEEMARSPQPPQIMYAITLLDDSADPALAADARDAEGLVGLCGLVLDRESEAAEAWYLLRPDLWGRGLTSEAMAAVAGYAFEELGLHRVWATCLPQNPASARVLERLGFRREGLMREALRIHGEWRDAMLYAILASEWGH